MIRCSWIKSADFTNKILLLESEYMQKYIIYKYDELTQKKQVLYYDHTYDYNKTKLGILTDEICDIIGDDYFLTQDWIDINE